MLALNKITWLHCEPSTLCNASCPACARNNSGFGIIKNLKLTNLTIEHFTQTIKILPNLKTVQMCGTFGDPIASDKINELIKICVDKKLEVRIHTNGSLRTKKWWRDLAILLQPVPHAIIFGIDGLAGTHEIHRQGTNFEKIISNAGAFIEANGTAEWQFLLFKHNVHQVKDCMRLSQKLGFKKFYTRDSIRIPAPARNHMTGDPYVIERVKEFITKESYDLNEKSVAIENCMHLSLPSIYLNASGKLTPCCYLKDLDYAGNDLDIDISNNNASDFCKTNCGVKHN